MSPDRTVDKLPVFLILDYTADMWRYVASVDYHLRNLVERLRNDGVWSRLEFVLVGMGGKTGVLSVEDVVKGHLLPSKQALSLVSNPLLCSSLSLAKILDDKHSIACVWHVSNARDGHWM